MGPKSYFPSIPPPPIHIWAASRDLADAFIGRVLNEHPRRMCFISSPDDLEAKNESKYSELPIYLVGTPPQWVIDRAHPNVAFLGILYHKKEESPRYVDFLGRYP